MSSHGYGMLILWNGGCFCLIERQIEKSVWWAPLLSLKERFSFFNLEFQGHFEDSSSFPSNFKKVELKIQTPIKNQGIFHSFFLNSFVHNYSLFAIHNYCSYFVCNMHNYFFYYNITLLLATFFDKSYQKCVNNSIFLIVLFSWKVFYYCVLSGIVINVV